MRGMRTAALLFRVGLAGLMAAPPVQAEPQRYLLDPTHSFVHFEVLHFGTSTLRGRLGPLKGEVMLDRAARRGRVQVQMTPGTITTGLAVLDARLQQPDLLDTSAHPTAWFVAEGFEFNSAGDVMSVRGEFTLRGVGQGLSLRALRFNCYRNPLLQRQVCGGDFEGELLRSDFGISFGLPFVADRVRLLVQVEAVAQ
jgi:polyisoprenoid-binding protein YceI